jgi:hypothetical protein
MLAKDYHLPVGGDCRMTDWMDQIVKRTKQKFGPQQLEDEKFLREQKLKHELGIRFYNELRSWLHRIEKEFNTRYGASVLVVTEAGQAISILGALTRNQSRVAGLSYNAQLQQFVWDTGTGGAHRVVQLKLAGDRMRAQGETQDWTVEEFGHEIIDGVLS